MPNHRWFGYCPSQSCVRRSLTGKAGQFDKAMSQHVEVHGKIPMLELDGVEHAI